MLEYNYIYDFLNKYGSYVNGVAQGSEEWRDITTNFSMELFKVLTNEEEYLLNKIKTSSSNTYFFKSEDNQ